MFQSLNSHKNSPVYLFSQHPLIQHSIGKANLAVVIFCLDVTSALRDEKFVWGSSEIAKKEFILLVRDSTEKTKKKDGLGVRILESDSLNWLANLSLKTKIHLVELVIFWPLIYIIRICPISLESNWKNSLTMLILQTNRPLIRLPKKKGKVIIKLTLNEVPLK